MPTWRAAQISRVAVIGCGGRGPWPSTLSQRQGTSHSQKYIRLPSKSTPDSHALQSLQFIFLKVSTAAKCERRQKRSVARSTQVRGTSCGGGAQADKNFHRPCHARRRGRGRVQTYTHTIWPPSALDSTHGAVAPAAIVGSRACLLPFHAPAPLSREGPHRPLLARAPPTAAAAAVGAAVAGCCCGAG